ncbi:hypothetical protein BDP27DRAFT_420815 [Rhodocollybia butyracea]|uniref:Uncharacterized protein n=1 Tax=Rhodocollybia butyracea TaxID=206335 RepID=A0A9P5U0D9_9AGAR|nr:hypothetical protein BDP27DRAFT_420815 [Rhodocollybia butyracea]
MLSKHFLIRLPLQSLIMMSGCLKLQGYYWVGNDVFKGSFNPTLAIEDISLICAASGNKLRDPVQCNVGVSERGFAMLHLPRAELYRPRSDSDQKESQLIELEPESLLPQLIRMGRQHPHRNSLVVLYPYRIGAAPSACTMRLEVAGRDFIASIQQANQTDLVTRGPLDLKAPAIIAPQLVLDSEGFIAVFTGRGCGSVRDINFFRPTASGDTAVDINDVANALDQVIPSRKMEKTWEIDTFSAAGAPSRDPAEAIFLCLDLSQSMNSKSGVEGTHRRIETSQEVKVQERINELTSNLTDNEILDQACTFVYKQHWTSLVALKSKLAFLKKQNGYRDDPGTQLH